MTDLLSHDTVLEEQEGIAISSNESSQFDLTATSRPRLSVGRYEFRDTAARKHREIARALRSGSEVHRVNPSAGGGGKEREGRVKPGSRQNRAERHPRRWANIPTQSVAFAPRACVLSLSVVCYNADFPRG